MSSTCSRPGCRRVPTATLVYDYASGVATIGALAEAHPMHYDLCDDHTDRLSVPRGWTLVDQRVRAAVADLHARRAS